MVMPVQFGRFISWLHLNDVEPDFSKTRLIAKGLVDACRVPVEEVGFQYTLALRNLLSSYKTLIHANVLLRHNGAHKRRRCLASAYALVRCLSTVSRGSI